MFFSFFSFDEIVSFLNLVPSAVCQKVVGRGELYILMWLSWEIVMWFHFFCYEITVTEVKIAYNFLENNVGKVIESNMSNCLTP